MKTNTYPRLLSLLWFPIVAMIAGFVSRQAQLSKSTHQNSPNNNLQFTPGGHVLGFASGGVFLATGSRALHVEFLNARTTNPVSARTRDADTLGRAQRTSPLSKVTYPNLWDGVTLTYDSPDSGVVRSTYRVEAYSSVASIRLRYNTSFSVQSDGSLQIGFPTGTLNESAPLAWQERNGKQLPVKTITIRPPLHSSCQLIVNNPNGAGTNPLNFFLSSYTITLDASPESAGTVSGVYNLDSTVVILATPNNGFFFLNWTEDGSIVSTSASYTFTATRNRALTANFSLSGTPSPTPTPRPAPLGNISTRLQVGTGDQVLIAGFIVQGTSPKRVIIRAAGPSLVNFGVPNALPNPQLELHDSASTIGMNDDWQTTQIGGVITADQGAEIQASGLAPTDPLESALIATLPPANYTAIAKGVNNVTGTGIVEIYDLATTSGSLLANVSTRGFVQTSDNVMIGGFIVSGSSGDIARVIVRAIGPSLPVAGTLADPTLELHDGNGTLIGSNDNWRSDQEAEIIATNLPPANDLESAIVRNFSPGIYTAIVGGAGNTTGVGLVDMYRLQQ